MPAIIAANLHVEQVLAQGRNEEGPFQYIAGWEIILDEVIGNGIGPRQNRGDGVNYWSHKKLWDSEEKANEFLDRIVDSGRKEINPKHWQLIGNDFRTWEDIEFEWNSYAEVERANG